MIYDAIAFAGVAMIGAGVAFFDWRAALVVTGVLLIALAVHGAKLNQAH